MSAFVDDRFYRPREVWRESHGTRAQVYEALRSGELRAIRRGRSWLVPGHAVTAWISRVGDQP
jgi:excisionase family DNA binding protein